MALLALCRVVCPRSQPVGSRSAMAYILAGTHSSKASKPRPKMVNMRIESLLIPTCAQKTVSSSALRVIKVGLLSITASNFLVAHVISGSAPRNFPDANLYISACFATRTSQYRQYHVDQALADPYQSIACQSLPSLHLRLILIALHTLHST